MLRVRDTPTAHADPAAPGRVRTPLWRRLTALVSLGSLVVITGILLAGVIGVTILLTLMLLERAAG